MAKRPTLRSVARDAIQRVADEGFNGIAHVGAANYRDREAEAKRWLQAALDEALRKVKRYRNRRPRKS